MDDTQVMAATLIENIQRDNLNAIEVAQALQVIRDHTGMGHEEIGRCVGKSRAAVSNLIRLLQLAPAVKEQLIQGNIEMGHARSVLCLPHPLQVAVCHWVISHACSVRQTEQGVKKLLLHPSVNHKAIDAHALVADVLGEKRRTLPGMPVSVKRWEQALQRVFAHSSAKAAITHHPKGHGQLTIKYASVETLERIMRCIHREDTQQGSNET